LFAPLKQASCSSQQSKKSNTQKQSRRDHNRWSAGDGMARPEQSPTDVAAVDAGRYFPTTIPRPPEVASCSASNHDPRCRSAGDPASAKEGGSLLQELRPSISYTNILHLQQYENMLPYNTLYPMDMLVAIKEDHSFIP
jgi:hypothetical protein